MYNERNSTLRSSNTHGHGKLPVKRTIILEKDSHCAHFGIRYGGSLLYPVSRMQLIRPMTLKHASVIEVTQKIQVNTQHPRGEVCFFLLVPSPNTGSFNDRVTYLKFLTPQVAKTVQ